MPKKVLTWVCLLSLICFSFHNTDGFAHAGEPLKVVFVGKYRSGSTSVAAALRRLGYNPCHGEDVVDNVVGSHSRLAGAFINGNVTEILQETSALGCNATMELHAIFWKQIADGKLSSDDTKFIVVRRRKDAWSKSVTNFHLAVAPIHRFPLRWIPQYGKLSELFSSLATREGGFESREQALKVISDPLGASMHEAIERVYNSFVMDTNEFLKSKPKNTLLFDLQEGYPPLCKFLGVSDCPREKFPHVHSTMDVMAKYSVPRRLELIINGILIAASISLTFLLWGKQSGKVGKTKLA